MNSQRLARIIAIAGVLARRHGLSLPAGITGTPDQQIAALSVFLLRLRVAMVKG